MDGLDELWIGRPSAVETRTSLPQLARRQILNALDYKEEIRRTSVSQANEDARSARGAGALSKVESESAIGPLSSDAFNLSASEPSAVSPASPRSRSGPPFPWGSLRS